MDKPLVRIENWAVVDDLIFQGFRELQAGQRLTGTLLATTDLPRGVIFTSVIQSIDLDKGLVETGSTVYRLGQVDEEWEQWETEQNQTSVPQHAILAAFIQDRRKPVVPYGSPASLAAQG
ncbi:MAG TPA: hypothetical protein VHU89_10190 [Acidobacteriaceae bacterium]|jgi:hypothetical protein|nr:hypothetical protein [Acidobacteriaceae bacterium]